MVGMTLDSVQWTALLKSVSAFEMFRKHYSLVTPRNVSEFLILNDTFPRSIHFCVREIDKNLNNIAKNTPDGVHRESIRMVGKLGAELEFSTIEEYVKGGLHETLDHIQRQLADLHNVIVHEFFS